MRPISAIQITVRQRLRVTHCYPAKFCFFNKIFEQDEQDKQDSEMPDQEVFILFIYSSCQNVFFGCGLPRCASVRVNNGCCDSMFNV